MFHAREDLNLQNKRIKFFEYLCFVWDSFTLPVQVEWRLLQEVLKDTKME